MKQRLVQLIARYIGIALMALAGMVSGAPVEGEAAAGIESFAGVIALALVGVVMLLADLVIHRLKNGGFFK